VAAHRYEIVVFGAAGPGVQAAFEGFDVQVSPNCTRMSAALIDQAELFGALDRVRDLGLELVALRRMDQAPDS